MYRLLIVDDEEGHREGLVALLRTVRPDYLVFEAANGAVALSMMDLMAFDLIITDIRMPQVDGIAFLERAKLKSPDTRVAILSAYGLFDYAKQCLALGADDYLLKPVDTEELRLCLGKMESRLESDRARFNDSAGEVGIGVQLYQFVMGRLSAAEHDAMKALFAPGDSGAVFYIQFRRELCSRTNRDYIIHPPNDPPNGMSSGTPFNAVDRLSYQIEIRRRMRRYSACVVFQSPVDLNVLIGIAVCNQDDYKKLLNDLTIESHDDLMTIGVQYIQGNYFDRMEMGYSAAMAACTRRFYEPDRYVFDAAGTDSLDPYTQARLDISINDIDEAITAGDSVKAYSFMERSLLAAVPGMYPSNIKEATMYAFMFLLGNITYPLSQRVKDELLTFVSQTVLECQNMHEMLVQVRCAFERIMQAIQADRSRSSDIAFDDIARYISEHMQRELSLSDISRRFHYHPTYFSSLFKRHVGMTFQEYMYELRMKEAARMLSETTLYAAKVGELVGYPNPTYFAKAFKKRFGVSPDQYRKRSVLT
ncbi:MAG: response regulator [Oscillospiraceae bacterium]|nr:response regulator [Oscillospiraceae bacterium]